MRDVEVLLHHRAGAADLVADLFTEIGRQQAVNRILNPVAFRFVSRRGIAGQRLQRLAAAAMVFAAARTFFIGDLRTRFAESTK
jgi:hypothetical protein